MRMPGGDGTGPLGLGPGTGRRAGYCGGFGVPGYANPAPPPWYGRRGWWWGWIQAPDAERQALLEQRNFLRRQMDWVEERLRQLESES